MCKRERENSLALVSMFVRVCTTTSRDPCRYGHVEAITVLLNDGECSPNLTTDTGSSPLHFAAANGHPYVVELLLNHPDIDVVRAAGRILRRVFVSVNVHCASNAVASVDLCCHEARDALRG